MNEQVQWKMKGGQYISNQEILSIFHHLYLNWNGTLCLAKTPLHSATYVREALYLASIVLSQCRESAVYPLPAFILLTLFPMCEYVLHVRGRKSNLWKSIPKSVGKLRFKRREPKIDLAVPKMMIVHSNQCSSCLVTYQFILICS